MRVFNRILNGVCIGLLFAWTLLCAVAAISSYLISERAGHAVQRAWGRGGCWLMGIHLTLVGLENVPRSGGAILAPNHASDFDIFVLAALPLKIKWVAKREVMQIAIVGPFVGFALRTMGSFFVRRDKSGHDMNIMKEVEDGLRAGAIVVIFPEGTRTRTGELLPFKKGAFRAAQNSGAPIVPIGLVGTYAIAPPGHLPSKRGHQVTIQFGKPFHPSPTESLPVVMGDFRSRLVTLLDSPSRA